jgi:opacity protein-like surface antigen
MSIRSVLLLALALEVFCAATPAFSQVAPEAIEGNRPFSVGAGVSNFNVDWGKTRMYGGTFWADWRPPLPLFLNGLGLEIEARDISLDRSSTVPSNFRQDTAGGGPIYTWRHYRNFRPYGKGLLEFGSFDFRSTNPNYSHDTRTLVAAGPGVEFRTYGHLWVRAEYEYQIWGHILGKRPDPQGFTLGAMYDFGGIHHRKPIGAQPNQ